MDIGRRLSRRFRILLKYTLNPLTLRLANAGIGPLTIVRHVGRRSGKEYATPLLLVPIAGGFVAELTYGPNVDWFQNVMAAGHCTVVRGGRQTVIDQIEPMDSDTGMQAFPLAVRVVLRMFRRRHFVSMHVANKDTGYPAQWRCDARCL